MRAVPGPEGEDGDVLTLQDVGAWLIKASGRPAGLPARWPVLVRRCLRRSYRLALVTPGQPCVLWVSGRRDAGVAAVGHIASPVLDGDDGPEVEVALTVLPSVVPRAGLLLEEGFRDAEVLRMPAGSNPSVLTPGQWSALRRRLPG